MKKLILILSLMFSICANAQIDSLSYAAGHQSILGMLAGNFPFIQTDNDIKELYRGIEENSKKFHETTDSAYMVNYYVGYLQGVFFSNSLEHTAEKDYPPVSCIIDGLKKVADNELTLPQDTIDAKMYIASFPDSVNPVQLPADERCKYFTALGILKGMPHGLKQLAEGYGIKNTEPNYQYYAQGFADMLEIMKPPENAYDYGKMIALAMRNQSCGDLPVDNIPDVMSADFLSGIRAALRLEALKLTEDEIDSIMERYYSSFEPAEVVTQPTAYNPVDADELPLAITLNVPHEVEWSFEAYAPMPYEDCTEEIIDAITSVTTNLQTFGIKSEPYDLSQVIYTIDNDNPINYYITEQVIDRAANEWYSRKPAFCKFFCGKDSEGKTIFGVSNTTDVFISKIFGASIDSNHRIEFYFGNDSTRKAEAERWKEFTKKNIGRLVVCELNDKVVMCPKVNSGISSGACAVWGSHLSNREINELFSLPVEPDEIEIIEIQ